MTDLLVTMVVIAGCMVVGGVIGVLWARRFDIQSIELPRLDKMRPPIDRTPQDWWQSPYAPKPKPPPRISPNTEVIKKTWLAAKAERQTQWPVEPPPPAPPKPPPPVATQAVRDMLPNIDWGNNK